ncbi:MAG TPA: alpha/beta hydrolase [Aestuariivirga sp.]|nr:alpha/beta hydrolase [Aestuariivirga sp.]
MKLFARDYRSAPSSLTPLLCLPGLTRNSKDFETIASWLAQTRRVIAPDFRGRGLSQYASDPASYRPDIELLDTVGLLNFLQIGRVAVIGTSRGGIVGMLMAAFFHDRLAGLFLNDVGPELDRDGLLRIRSYLGVQSELTSWEMAVANLKSNNMGFESLTADEWRVLAQRAFKSVDGLPRFDYDPALLHTFPSVEDVTAGRVANLWEFFGKTESLPVAVVRGEHSDLLSAATVEAMKQENPGLDATTIPERGHAPFLDEAPAKDALVRWLARVDAQENGR